MKPFIFLLLAGFSASTSIAQVKEGKIIYERTTESTMYSRMSGSSEVETKAIKNVDAYQLLFNAKQSLLEILPDMNAVATEGEGRTIRMGSSQGKMFTNLERGTSVTENDLMATSYLVEGSVRKINWKLTGETKTILGMKAEKAVGKDYVVSRVPSMENGAMKFTEKGDSVEVIAWYTKEIPVTAGPDFAGQLPGLILELVLENGRQSFKAVEISKKYNASALKAPTKGQKISEEDYEKAVAKMNESMNEMLKQRGRNRKS